MNAYELADELENVDAKNYREIAANMLRQQADHIAELEKENKELHKIAQVMAMKESDARKSLKNYKDYPIKELSDEDIESLIRSCSFDVDTMFSEGFKNEQYLCLESLVKAAVEIGIAQGFAKALTQYPPVTTPQIKELSDEEILEEWTWKYTDCFEDFLLKFAKAILRKAQEK